MLRQVLSSIILFVFTATTIAPISYAQEIFNLPSPGTMVEPSPAFSPIVLTGIKVFPQNPFRLDFYIDTGHQKLKQEDLDAQANRLIKYFLVALTVPEENLWVNLSPYEKNRIAPEKFDVTEMGKDLLAQDYMLKQLTASLTNPDSKTGKSFWEKAYKEAFRKYGTTEAPINTFNKVWIVPDRAGIYQSEDGVFIVDSHLKVMLETDYLAQKENKKLNEGTKALKTAENTRSEDISLEVMRSTIIPEIEKEVNQGTTFAQLRQIYNSVILGLWFKENLKKSLLGEVYADKNKIKNVDINDKQAKEKIYKLYVEAFKKGVFNYIREDYDPATQETVPRKYFSGGTDLGKPTLGAIYSASQQQFENGFSGRSVLKASVNLELDFAMLAGQGADRAIQKIRAMSAVDLENLFRKAYHPELESRETRVANVPLGAGVVAIRKIDGEFYLLMGRRSPKAKDEQGAYLFPTGGVNQSESTSEAALRELKEEAGIDKKIDDIVGRVEDFRNQQGTLFDLFLMVDSSDSKEVRGNGELDNFQWVPLTLFLTTPPAQLASILETHLEKDDTAAYLIQGLKEEGLSKLQVLLLRAIEPLAQEESSFTARDLRKLTKAVSVLSQQDANVVFERRKDLGKWVFRRGPIDLEIDSDLTQKLGDRLEAQGHESILIGLRNNSSEDLQGILENVLSRGGNILDEFNTKGIKTTNQFKRVLLIAPYGDMEGRPLRYKVPSKGVEIIAHRILRETEDVDALVYNPNLSSIEDLYEFVRNNHFDIIGISVLQTVLKENLRILGQLSLISPNSTFIAGGAEISKFPTKEIFESWPVDALSFDVTGDSFIEAARKISPNQAKEEKVKVLKSVSNIALNDPQEGVVTTQKSAALSLPVLNNPSAEIPIEKPDLTHGEVYDKADDISAFPVALDRIGRQPTRVPYGNFCKGKCIYCGTPLNTKPDLAADEVVQLIRKGQATLQDDSVHFESADFFFDQKHAADVADVLAASEDIRRIPKLAIARVDEIGDGELLRKLSRAGFKIVAYGVESFDDTVLKKIGKQTSEEQNKKALDLTIQAGIKPGMNLILFTPWDTIDTTLKMINYSLGYMERGAYINVVPYLFSGYGRAISRSTRFLEYEEYNFPGLKKPFRFPRLATNFDPEIARLKLKVQEKYEDLKQQANYPQWAQRSVTIDSLLYFKSFILLLIEEGLRDRDQMNAIVTKIDEAIARTMRAESSTMKDSKDLTARGVVETWFNTQNQLLTKVVLMTEDEQRIVLKLKESNISQGNLPAKMTFDIYRASKEGNESGESFGYVELALDQNKITSSQIVFNHSQDANVFIHGVISDFVEDVRANTDLLKDSLADSQKAISNFTVHYHRLPSEPLFGQVISPAVYEGISREDLINQIHATYQEGYLGLADAIYQSMDRAMLITSYKSKYYLPFNEIDKISLTPEKFLRPDLAVSDMDLTQFPEDKDAEQVIPELAQKALKYRVAAVSIYPKHLKYLPVEKLKSAGIKVGVVVAFPNGLGRVNIDNELATLEKAVQEGADEVDFVIDFESVLKGNVLEAEKSLAKFALGVEDIKRRLSKPIKMKAILETQALRTEGNIRTAARIALKYVDMIKMVSGFPIEADGNQKGRANLSAAKIMLEEILYYYKRTGILRGMKITGGISDWNDPDKPQQSALNYYNLILEVLGRHLGSHYIYERDLFRVGGYDGLLKFINASQPEQMRPQSHVLSFQQAKYDDLDIPSEQETSLKMGEYLRTKFPAGLLQAVDKKESKVEIYRGSATASENYIRSLVFQGYTVEELPSSDKFPPHHKFYRIQDGQEVTFLIIGLIGSGRELFMVQALTRYFGYPEDQITIRVFDEGGYRYFFNKSLGKYAGSIHKAVILHQIDDYVREISKGDNIKLKVVERIKNDFVDAVIIQTENNGLVLLFEMQFANASHAEQVAEYLTSSVEQGGLGIKDLTLHGAAGGVGQNIQINDLVVYNDVYWKQEKVDSIPKNDVDVKRLDDLLPNGVEIRQAPIYDIPTVLNGSIAFMDEVERHGGGAIELEVVHAIKAVVKQRDIKFRAFYEIHDKPATTQQLDKMDAMGQEVAGYRDLEKRYDTWRALAKYLFSGNSEEPLPSPSSKREKDIQSWRSAPKAEVNLTGYRRDARAVRRVLVEGKKDNLILLGQGEGVRYFSNLQNQWNQEKDQQGELIYWDAREYLLSLNQGANISDLLSDVLKSTSSASKIIFVDNIDVILQDQNLRNRFLEALAVSNVAVIGYMPVQSYTNVEESFDQLGKFNHEDFGRLNFEVATEENPVVQTKKVVILGATGFVGSQVLKQLKEKGFTNIVGVSQTGSIEDNVVSLDLTNHDQLRGIVKDADIVINAAVNLDFSGMQAGGEALEKARSVNVGIPEFVASMGFKGQFIQLSSYYVFGDNSNKATTQNSPQPGTVYGQQKLMAEDAVSRISRHAIIRLGPMFGLDATGRQKEFFRSIVRQLEAKRQGQATQPISAATYPLSALVYVKDVAESIVALTTSGMTGVSQISGEQPLDAVQQAQLIAKVYNKKFGTNLTLDLNILQKARTESLTPDVQMYSVTTPDLENGINDFIDEVLQDQAMMGTSIIEPVRDASALANRSEGEEKTKTGGIDLSPTLRMLNISGLEIKFDLPSNIQRIDSNIIEGINPTIFQIVPFNFPLMSGRKLGESKESLLSKVE